MGCNRSTVCAVCCCLLTIMISIGGIVCLVAFLLVVPLHKMKFHVIDASLTEFYLTNDDILHYNLAVNISVRNNNKMERISYSDISSNIMCYGQSLTSISLSSFRLGTKNTTSLHLVFQGQSTSFNLQGSDLRDFSNDQRDGSYMIYVDLFLTTQLKYAGGGDSTKNDIVVECELSRLPLLGSSSLFSNQSGIGDLFHSKRCEVYIENNEG
ncbi:hypothetical protein MKW98_028970 [Papaver atlanticum]|uniref:Late embryogenesis abundant protein LEA-2 subgroup domain-containing protein n=1 Tax=Papaver atlanticum TaxID=357466 RepID=A0AAD4TKU0_9MAGN|nr:hypothetical protein MKW98_028970 [Papaver atlanticum]